MLAAAGGPVGAASGLLNMSRGLGTALGTAIVTVTYTSVSRSPRDGITAGALALLICCLTSLALTMRGTARDG
jgi:hypothetical protein